VSPAAAVTIVGAGMAGAACAAALAQAGMAARVVERGRAPGGRMASPSLHGRRVDLGASYFTVADPGFAAVVEGWAAQGLARPWTDTFAILAPGQAPTTTTGPMRWAAPGGLRSLVRALLGVVEVELGAAVNPLPDGAVALAMPDPQASRLTTVASPVDYQPVIAVASGFDRRAWPFADAAFVNGHPDIDFIADDGARRGDGASVLVAHTTAERARRHLDDPDAAIPAVTAALTELCGTPPPTWAYAHRWRFAKPAGAHATTFGTAEQPGKTVWLAGDQWCPERSPRVESAWRSGTDVAHAILAARDEIGAEPLSQ
jgi:predicted NAD/FAD-dependent oxidoreductase